MGRLSFDKERFDAKLAEIMDEQPASYLLSIPGIYEVVSEYYNNSVLRELSDEDIDAEEIAALLKEEEEDNATT